VAEISQLPTEQVLSSWRFGQTQAERLCAGLLIVEGFVSVDPQCPLGGPDGLKDVVCQRGALRYIAAAFFPPKANTFAQVQKKFRHDLGGVGKNHASAIIFLTNQKLSPTERLKLQEVARERGTDCVIYHLERIRAVLDAPSGYGLRLEFLKIPMTPEEQAGFLIEWKSDVRDAIRDQTARVDRLAAEMRLLRAETQSALGIKLASPEAMPIALPDTGRESISGRLTLDLLLMIHRAACADSCAPGTVGVLRNVDVWIGKAGEDRRRAMFTPPAAAEIGPKLDELLRWWNSSYFDLCSGSEEGKVDAIARFYHGILYIHPFVDGNGRVARNLLFQQILDLFGPRDSITLDQGVAYYSALQAADKGDLSKLSELVARAVNT
jgi:fido (protein-threonine AMPylation protein)